MVQVIDNEICYKWSEYQNVKQIYHTRFEMHQRVYSHRQALPFCISLPSTVFACG